MQQRLAAGESDLREAEGEVKEADEFDALTMVERGMHGGGIDPVAAVDASQVAGGREGESQVVDTSTEAVDERRRLARREGMEVLGEGKGHGAAPLRATMMMSWLVDGS